VVEEMGFATQGILAVIPIPWYCGLMILLLKGAWLAPNDSAIMDVIVITRFMLVDCC